MERLPDLFWLAFVSNRLGDQKTCDVVFEMATSIESTIHRARGNQIAFRAYVLSEHLSCTPHERDLVASGHQDANWAQTLAPHIRDMAVVWPELPIGYLASPDNRSTVPEIVLEVKNLLGRCQDRHENLAIRIQSIAVSLELRTGHLKLPRGLEIPDLNTIPEYPETEESRKAAGFIVSTCTSLLLCRTGGDKTNTFRWPRMFWNSCFNQGTCEHE
jgi:hypothetical protein